MNAESTLRDPYIPSLVPTVGDEAVVALARLRLVHLELATAEVLAIQCLCGP